MEIKIQIRGRVFSICLGHKTEWFENKYWFTLCEEWYDKREVVYAKMLKWF